jgi:hypothetical protein
MIQPTLGNQGGFFVFCVRPAGRTLRLEWGLAARPRQQGNVLFVEPGALGQQA